MVSGEEQCSVPTSRATPTSSQNFIQDIRGCQNKEQEQKRVEKELAKVREKFGDDKGLSGSLAAPQHRAWPCHVRLTSVFERRL